MNRQAKVPRRKKLGTGRRLMVGASVRPELYDALTEEATEKGISVSKLAGDVLAEYTGVPA